jgi:PQQ-dependent dehydrogenase (methanol/ethanol family)
MVGVSGGELGIRGFVVALDAETGTEAWRTYTVPGPGEFGNDTWPGDSWQTGGAAVWITGNYDPDLGLTYWGTGNPGPWIGDARPGDNLYTNSVIALDIQTGELRGYHQFHWNGSWDWDEVSTPMLMPVRREGRVIPALVHPGRNGYLWILERERDRISFVDAEPYVYQDVFTSIDVETGRPTYDESRKPRTGRTTSFCPSLWGGKDWPPAAYNPGTGLVYIPANNNLCGAIEGREAVYRPGSAFTGASTDMTIRPGADHIGELQAWDMNTGRAVWTPRVRGRELGWRADDRRKPRLQRRHERSVLPRLRCAHRRAALAAAHKLRRHRCALDILGRRCPVRRRAIGMGRRRGIDGGTPRSAARHEQLRAAGRGHLGVRVAAVARTSPTTPRPLYHEPTRLWRDVT